MAPKKKGEAEPAKPSKAKKVHNLVDPAIRKTFIDMRDHWSSLNDRAKSAAGKLRQYGKEIKEAGFTISQVKISLLVESPEGEAEFKARLANELLAAAYAGAEVGDQLSLFLEPDRTPATDRAFKEGEKAAMENKAHAPPYDPSVPQYKAWSDGFYAEQERQIKGGIKKLDDKAGKDAKATKPKRGRPSTKDKESANGKPPAGSERTLIPKAEKDAKAAAKAPKADSQPPRTAPAVAPVTRADLKRQREAAREQAESYFTKAEPAGNA